MLTPNKPIRLDSHTKTLRAHLIGIPFDPEHGLFEDCGNRRCWEYLANVAPKPLLLRVLCGEYMRPRLWPDTWANQISTRCPLCQEAESLRRGMPAQQRFEDVICSNDRACRIRKEKQQKLSQSLSLDEPGRAGTHAEQE